MNKGTTVVIGLLCFLAGMGLMWGIAQDHGVQVSAEVAQKGTPDQSNSPIPIEYRRPRRFRLLLCLRAGKRSALLTSEPAWTPRGCSTRYP